MQAAYRDHAGNREPMFKRESNYSAKGNLPAIKQPRDHAQCRPHVSDAIPLFEPPYAISPLLFRCPLQRLTLAHTASLDPGGPESDLSGLSHFGRGTTQRP